MLIGLPASGKSYISEVLVKQEKLLLFSSDIVREKLKMDASNAAENIRLFDVMYEMIRQELMKGNDVLLDSTNTYRKYRQKLLQSLSEDTEVIGVLLLRQIENCLEANENRENRIDEGVIRLFYEEYDLPLYEEGFDRFLLIYPDEDEYALTKIDEEKENIGIYRSLFLHNGLSRIEKLHQAQEKEKRRNLWNMDDQKAE